jgi:D-serine deaminase-like pyridoxal phosphate-dependent protein
MREIAQLELAQGIAKHKCATLAEAEMLATTGAKDIFLAYPIVGPNIGRVVRFCEAFPDVALLVCGDHPQPLDQLGHALTAAGKRVGIVVDLDVGQHRTGVAAGPAAEAIYGRIARTPGIYPAGLHVYDGHNHQTDIAERTAAVRALWAPVVALRDRLVQQGLDVPRIIAGGTGTFPVFASFDEPTLELSPGTIVLHDAGYSRSFPDLKFTPAAGVLTRVISFPMPGRFTCDLGYKAIASDPPAGQRLVFPDLPDARCVLQNEEHLVVETSRAAEFSPGDLLLAIPWHICPTSALHAEAHVVRGGRWVETWQVAARNRLLTI